ncbi:MAG TPA: aminopeptidase [Saprospiraceae bacterium]|nr:aminopeptidase [Saprospiraceae bacterium]HNT21044.1 aminopeptidase [Saprospiraceae bacterium]
MHQKQLEAYSRLLLDYSLRLGRGDKLYIQTTTLALPLVRQLYEGALRRLAVPVIHMSFEGQEELQNQLAHEEFIRYINPAYAEAVEQFHAFLFIRAPFDDRGFPPMDKGLQALRREVTGPLQKTYAIRTGNQSLRRTLCQYPTPAGAKEASMTTEEFGDFIAAACFLDETRPEESWKQLGREQQAYVDFLNGVKQITFRNEKTEMTCSVDGRTWINSDGKNNMPSGEVYTSPVEDSVEGRIYFDYPFTYEHHTIRGVSLRVEKGKIVEAGAEEGNEKLQEILEIPGARSFGEIAIGTNTHIQRPTCNILFDEKMAGTVHMAIGQSYLQCGGKNESAVHQDMIADMRRGGQIWADGRLIYENGVFLEVGS